MVVEEFPDFLKWFLPDLPGSFGAFIFFLAVVAFLCLVGSIFGYLVCAIRHGPQEGFYVLSSVIVKGVPDLFRTSPRRTMAIAMLAIQETVRRRVLLAVFGIFAVGLLVGGWFLDVKSEHPDRIYIGFVLTGTQYLTLLLMLLLTAFSLPVDIKNKTIYTIVTKPVRASEIVLGRIVGFGVIGTVLLLLMCIISYLFVIRGLTHTHQLNVDELADYKSNDSDSTLVKEGVTTTNSRHSHEFKVLADGHAYTEMAMGHTHNVQKIEDDDGNVSYKLGPPEGILQARVPVYGKLSFLDRAGVPSERGINTGSEWTYRSYIAGGTLASAIWKFEGIRMADFIPSDFTREERKIALTPIKDRSASERDFAREHDLDERLILPLELSLSVFRSHKGNIERGITVELFLKNPDRAIETEPLIFESREFLTQQINLPRKLKAEEVTMENGVENSFSIEEADLFHDIVSEEGSLELWIQCPEPAQYLGMAQADVYVRASDRAFFANFFKAFASFWLQMIVVVSAGVMFSTFLNSAVTLMATVGYLVLGFFVVFIRELASGEILGGGPIESIIRIITQKNVMQEFDQTFGTLAMQMIDAVILWFMYLATYTVPEFLKFDTSNYLSYGFNISADLMMMNFATAMGFFVSLTVIGYFFLKAREIAA